ncbi:uncharacterized protein LOC122252791 [Penaeus japonicus]|uniref:uncharacterized protein LOC122252791 n=1 Tax=Penaeus japonicus TaxID=27405 RepID=UPI001C70DC03|nr:uncharacterized protein LOC122252791 [Penaeus japonicus]
MINFVLFFMMAALVPRCVDSGVPAFSSEQPDFPLLPRSEWYSSVAARLQKSVDWLTALSRNVSRLVLLREIHGPSGVPGRTQDSSHPFVRQSSLPPKTLANETSKDKGTTVFEAVLAVLIMLLLLAAVVLSVPRGDTRPRHGLV